MNNEWERMWKEAVFYYSRPVGRQAGQLSRYSLGGSGGGGDSARCPEYEAGVPTSAP